MMIRILLVLTLALLQAGCGAEYGEGLYPFEVDKLSDVLRQVIERKKRELLQIEDINVGEGPVAAWGRRLYANVDVRYADGTVVYQGPIVSYIGFHQALYNALKDPHLLSTNQYGIELGLNGMAVGGRRRITVDRSLVCMNIKLDTDPRAECHLIVPDRHGNYVGVHKEMLIVEATLSESCSPVLFRAIYMNGAYVINWQVGCRYSTRGHIDPTVPIWRLY